MFKKITAAFVIMTHLLTGIILGTLNTKVTDIDYGGTSFVEHIISQWLPLVEQGESEYVIVKGADCSPSEATAASELQNYFRQISGTTLPIVTDASASTAKEIVVGKTTREAGGSYQVDRAMLGDEGFMVTVIGEKLVIAGGELRGTLYGVYNFLEQNLGCRWFTPELTVIPNNTTIKIDATLNYTQQPKLEYRDQDWRTALDENWKVKQKINSGNMSAGYGGGVSYADFCHSMERLVPETYFAAHPEYFSYRDEYGTRTTRQRCLTNPDVLAITVASARAAILANPNAKIMSITQNDNGDYCQCLVCKASDDMYGGPSGTNIWFVNQVAAALEEEFPNVAFDTFAYQYTRKPPVNIVPGQNVIVRLCSIECCFVHPISSCGHVRGELLKDQFSEIKSSFAEDLKGWSAICDRVYIWDYTTNFEMYVNPFPNFHVLSPNMQFFAENNVKGVFEEGNATPGKSGEFGELRAYIIAKLLWDPNCDVEYHMMDFMKAYYGEDPAQYIKQYIDKITSKSVKSEHLFIFDKYDQGVYYTPKERKNIDAMWDAAEGNTVTPEQLANVKRSRLSFRYYKANMFFDEFSLLNISRLKENELLYNDLVDSGITALYFTRPMSANPNFWLRPIDWD